MARNHARVLIVVCGNAGHGKDTLADSIQTHIPGSERDAFAVPLKQCVHLKTGIPMWVLNGPKEVKEDPKYGAYGKTARRLMQDEGEGARQAIGLTVWMDRLAERFLASGAKVSIVSDGRHPTEEMMALKERVGDRALVVFVVVRRPDVPVNTDHVSESRIAAMPNDDFDFVVMNTGTPEDLMEKAKQLAVATLLWAQTGKLPERGWLVHCPGGGSQPWPYATEDDAEKVATLMPCDCCVSRVKHEVRPIEFDGLVIP